MAIGKADGMAECAGLEVTLDRTTVTSAPANTLLRSNFEDAYRPGYVRDRSQRER
jgi:hypothetical protein